MPVRVGLSTIIFLSFPCPRCAGGRWAVGFCSLGQAAGEGQRPLLHRKGGFFTRVPIYPRPSKYKGHPYGHPQFSSPPYHRAKVLPFRGGSRVPNANGPFCSVPCVHSCPFLSLRALESNVNSTNGFQRSSSTPSKGVSRDHLRVMRRNSVILTVKGRKGVFRRRRIAFEEEGYLVRDTNSFFVKRHHVNRLLNRRFHGTTKHFRGSFSFKVFPSYFCGRTHHLFRFFLVRFEPLSYPTPEWFCKTMPTHELLPIFLFSRVQPVRTTLFSPAQSSRGASSHPKRGALWWFPSCPPGPFSEEQQVSRRPPPSVPLDSTTT